MKMSFLNKPFLQINIVEVEDIKFFEVYPLQDKYVSRYQTTSITDLLEFIDDLCQEEI